MTVERDDAHRLSVGVVGHRHLPAVDEAGLAAAVETFIAGLARRRPGGTVELVSGLADGADLLVAGVAAEIGIPVRAVLPMPVEMYRRDFSPQALTKLEQLLSSENVEVQELAPPPDVDLGMAERPGPERDRLYGGLRDHLIRRSHLLLALWDGMATGLEGGTGDVVLQYLGGASTAMPYAGPVVFEETATEEPIDGKVVAWLKVRRSEHDERPKPSISFLTGTTGSGRLAWSAELAETVWAELLTPETTPTGEGPGAPATGLLDGLDRALDSDLIDRLASIDAEYVRADGRAIHNQQRADRVFKSLALIAGAMGLLFLLYAKVEPLAVFLAGYLVLIVGGYLVYDLARRRDWFTRHLAYRVKAESLRVRFYLVLAGIEDRVDAQKLLDLTGITGLSGFGELGDSLRLGESQRTNPQHAGDEEVMDVVRHRWIEDQAGYFRSRIGTLTHRNQRLQRVKSGLFGLSFLAGVALLFFSHDLGEIELFGDVDGKTLVLVLMGLLPVWLGVWEIYQSKMAIRELIWQYRNQAEHFTEAAEAFAATESPADRQRILVDLGERSLFEVYLWSIHRFHREYEPSLPG